MLHCQGDLSVPKIHRIWDIILLSFHVMRLSMLNYVSVFETMKSCHQGILTVLESTEIIKHSLTTNCGCFWPLSTIRPLLFFCFSLNRQPHTRVWAKTKRRSRAQCVGQIHQNSQKSDKKKRHTEHREEWWCGTKTHLMSFEILLGCGLWFPHLVPESLMAERSKAVASDAVAKLLVGSNPTGVTSFFCLFEQHLNSVGSLLRGSTASS